MLIFPPGAQVGSSLATRPSDYRYKKFANAKLAKPVRSGMQLREAYFLFHVSFPDLAVMETGDRREGNPISLGP